MGPVAAPIELGGLYEFIKGELFLGILGGGAPAPGPPEPGLGPKPNRACCGGSGAVLILG